MSRHAGGDRIDARKRKPKMVECAICEKPCDDECKNRDGEPVHLECLTMVVGHGGERLYRCPHCGKNTPHPRAGLWDKLLSSRVTCRECGQEFLIADDAPVAGIG
jgi:hypothetical protein